MTEAEKKSISEIKAIGLGLLQTVEKFQAEVRGRISEAEAKVKFAPVQMEQAILSTLQSGIKESILKALTGYDSVLPKLVNAVAQSHHAELVQIVDDAFVSVIRTSDFKEGIRTEFAHKIARTIIGRNDALLDKIANEMRNDQTFRARATLAVSSVVDDILKERNPS